jgi:hypothetical protein
MRFGFEKLNKVDILVYDQERIEDLSNYLLKNFSFDVLYTRKEKFNLHPYLLVYLLLYVGKAISLYLIPSPAKGISFLSLLYLQYFRSYIRMTEPKIILTFIDNDIRFYTLKQYFPEIEFWAIQNGSRCIFDASKWIPGYYENETRFAFDRFYCFGKFEESLYLKYGHSRINFYPVGSFFLDVFVSLYGKSKKKKRYDICLISNFQAEHDSKEDKGIIRANLKLSRYLARFVQESKTKIIVALRTSSDLEKKYFQRYFGESVEFTNKKENKFASYLAIQESELAVTFFSTLGFEALSMGTKTIFVNYSRIREFDPPSSGIWFMLDEQYLKFKLKLLFLLKLPAEGYNKEAKDFSKYTLDTPEIGTVKFIQNEIHNKILNNK